MDTLNEQKIRAYCLPFLSHASPNIHVFQSIDSTNQYLKNLPFSTSLELCCAEEQTKGRGRLGRTWYSPARENIYCSIRWHFSGPISTLSALSLVVALAILTSLKTLHIDEDIWVKWPNDLYWHGKKLAGILIESNSDAANHQSIVVGIGLNVNTQTLLEETQNKLDRPWCSLRDMTGKTWDRNQLIGTLCGITYQYLQRYLSEGFMPFIAEWKKFDGLYQQPVHVTFSNTHHLNGTALGITEEGQLCVMDGQGKMHFLMSGEVTRCLAVSS